MPVSSWFGAYTATTRDYTLMGAPIGLSVKRREDRRLLTGRGRYVDDLRLPTLLHAAIVRSPHAHARIVGVDADRARARPRVVAALTIAELPECAAAVPPLVTSPRLRPYAQPAIVGPKVRSVGEAVAVVVADDVYRAGDAAQAVDVRYESLPATGTVEAALAKNAPRYFDEWPDNVAGPADGAVGDVARGFAEAYAVVEARLHVPRVAAMPIEPRGVVAQPDAPDGRLTVWASTQMPFAVRAAVAAALGLAEEQVRVIAPDVGGGFGAKGHVYPEDVLIPAVARRLGRPVKWIETRREHFVATAPDRDQHHQARLGIAEDGTITAVETTFTRDGGAYPVIGDVIALNTINHLPGPFRIAHLRGAAINIVTHKTFTAAYRGAGRPEGAYVFDRLLDRAARRLRMDPAEARRRNLIRPDEMPHATGLRYRDRRHRAPFPLHPPRDGRQGRGGERHHLTGAGDRQCRRGRAGRPRRRGRACRSRPPASGSRCGALSGRRRPGSAERVTRGAAPCPQAESARRT